MEDDCGYDPLDSSLILPPEPSDKSSAIKPKEKEEDPDEFPPLPPVKLNTAPLKKTEPLVDMSLLVPKFASEWDDPETGLMFRAIDTESDTAILEVLIEPPI